MKVSPPFFLLLGMCPVLTSPQPLSENPLDLATRRRGEYLVGAADSTEVGTKAPPPAGRSFLGLPYGQWFPRRKSALAQLGVFPGFSLWVPVCQSS